MFHDRGMQLPPTRVVRTARGWHYWYRHPGTPIPNTVQLFGATAPAIDIRGDGGIVVAPPSIHPDGHRYEFKSALPGKIAKMPEKLIELLVARRGAPLNSSGRDTLSAPAVDQLVATADLVRLVAHAADVTLQPGSGGDFVGLCPLHPDTAPSFTVTPSKRVWHCFGCQRGGTAIQFLTHLNGWSFQQAYEALRNGSVAA